MRKCATLYPNFVSLLQIMAASAANTSYLERSYSLLQEVAANKRNHFTPENLEIQYLLGVLKVVNPVKKPQEYSDEAVIISKDKQQRENELCKNIAKHSKT